MTLIKTLSLLMTLGVIYATYRYAGHPSAPRFLNQLGVAFALMGVPLLLLLILTAAMGRWAPFFFICAMISAASFTAAIGYLTAQYLTDNDPFEWGMFGVFAGMFLAGGPAAIYLLP